MKTLVVTEKKSVADDFAKTLGGFQTKPAHYERDDMIIAWASGHLLELQDPSAYDPKLKRWALADLPIIPEDFARVPRDGQGRSKELLERLVKLMRKEQVGTIVNACDAGREGELIFNLVLDHARARDKTVKRLWLQSMTRDAIRKAFNELKDAEAFRPLREAAYARDEADWLVGMNGTRAFTKKFMGRAKQFFAVGRVKTPTLAFLVDREREIDAFLPVPYFQIEATFETGRGSYTGRWHGKDEAGKRSDRLARKETAETIVQRVAGKPGVATEKHTKRTEAPPLLYDLTSLQRDASSRYGYTLDRTLSIVQSLYEARKAVTYPRTSSRYLPSDYATEIPKIMGALKGGEFGHVAARAFAEGGGAGGLQPAKRDRVFNDAKVSDHFALIPTGENPKNLRDAEARIYEMILRRFFAVFLPAAVWENVQRQTLVEGETFLTSSRRLAVAGWRAVEPVPDHGDLPVLKPDGAVETQGVDLIEKETQPPPRFSDGTLVKAMETAGQDVAHPGGEEDTATALDEEALENLKEKGIGTPATRASIVEDLIRKRLARRQGRTILPTPLGCTLVRLVRNLDLGVLAKPDLTGMWEYRLAQMAEGRYARKDWDAATREMVREMVTGVRERKGGNEEIFAVDHPEDGSLKSPATGAPLIEKTFSYMSSDPSEDLNISKDQRGKYLFPETLARLLREGRAGPLTGFEGTRAPGMLKLAKDGTVEIELTPLPSGDDDEPESDAAENQREEIPDGTVMGKCPKCGGTVTREGSGYRCEKNIPRKKDKECDFRLADRIKYRYLPASQVRKMLSGEKTDELFGFVSMRGKKFKASLYYEGGELKWEFPPKKPRAAKAAKKAPRKAAKKTTGKSSKKAGGKGGKDA